MLPANGVAGREAARDFLPAETTTTALSHVENSDAEESGELLNVPDVVLQLAKRKGLKSCQFCWRFCPQLKCGLPPPVWVTFTWAGGAAVDGKPTLSGSRVFSAPALLGSP